MCLAAAGYGNEVKDHIVPVHRRVPCCSLHHRNTRSRPRHRRRDVRKRWPRFQQCIPVPSQGIERVAHLNDVHALTTFDC